MPEIFDFQPINARSVKPRESKICKAIFGVLKTEVFNTFSPRILKIALAIFRPTNQRFVVAPSGGFLLSLRIYYSWTLLNHHHAVIIQIYY